jgi:hypothetical protein
MERLERIKKETEFNHFHYPETGKFALAFNLKQDDFDWLIEQAEKAERYEEALTVIQGLASFVMLNEAPQQIAKIEKYATEILKD